jgi:RHS repeat-associated protein
MSGNAFANANVFRYTGREATFSNDWQPSADWPESKTNVYHYRSREYLPGLGQFARMDDLATPNRYGYVDGNPVMFVDQFGNLRIDPSIALITPVDTTRGCASNTAIGAREYDQGDALMLEGLSHIFNGAIPLLISSDEVTPALGPSPASYADVNAIILGIEKIEEAIKFIIEESDDQSNDFIPRNLFEGTGTFTIPGILPPTEVRELLLELGVSEETIEDGAVDQWLLAILGLAKQFVRTLV